MPGGEIPWAQQMRLLAMGQWLSINGDAIYGSRPHEVSKLSTSEGQVVRLTKGADGAIYAMVCGRSSTANLVIDGLPAGAVHLLGYKNQLKRDGNTVVLPVRPDDTPVYTLRIG